MADNYKFVIEGNDKTRAMFKSIKANLGGLRGAVNSTTAKIGGLVGVAGLGAMVSSSLEVNDVLAKTADRLGTTTRELSAYQHLANLTGSSNQGVNKALELMNRNLGDAERGTGEARQALADLNLTTAELNAMPTGQRFETIALAIGQVKDRSLQASYAADIFGRSGTDLINMIDSGAEGFAQAKEEVDAYGVALSRVDAAKMEAANDAIFRAQQVGQGLTNQLTIHLAPIIEETAIQLTNATREAGGMGAVVQNTFDSGIKVAGVFADGIHGVQILFQGGKTVAWGFGAAVVGALKMGVEHAYHLGNSIKNFILAPMRGALELGTKLPGVGDQAREALAFLDENLTDAEPPPQLQAAFDYMVNGISDARGELHAMMMEELPSQVLAQKVEGILEGADVRAQQIAAKAMSVGAANDAGQGTGAGADGLTDQEREQLSAKLETLQLSWLTELEQLQVKQDQEMAILDQAYASKLINHDAYERNLTQLEGKHAKQREKLEKASSKNRWKAFGSAMDMMLGISNTGSKKLFKIQKALSLAKAVATLPSAIIESYHNSGGYPWGIPAAVAMAATGAMQIAQIKSSNFSGGGGGVGSVSAGGGGLASAPPSQGASLDGINQFASNDQQQSGTVLHLTIQGDLIGDNAQTIADQIKTLITEQDYELIETDSRQAQSLAG
ncbi:hypothetical protein ACJJIU_22095 (plasmid) [Microbulbifer sp. CnH-101-E]|uniref:hypothetical protein n=1 Tax=unclassified Microbulbifer TaxID=2619833 RepID=UPI00403A06C6